MNIQPKDRYQEVHEAILNDIPLQKLRNELLTVIQNSASKYALTPDGAIPQIDNMSLVVALQKAIADRESEILSWYKISANRSEDYLIK